MMSDIFLAILNNAWITSILIILLLVGRKIFKSMPKYLTAFMWGILAIKLILPFEIKSPFGLFPSRASLNSESSANAPVIVRTGIQKLDIGVNNYIEISKQSSNQTMHLQLHSIDILTIIWLAGFVTLFTYMLVSYYRMRKTLSQSVLIEQNVSVCDDISCPFLIGIIKPHIYIPSGMDKDAYEYVLSHEKMHIRHRDYLWKLLAFFLLCIYWFNPLCWLAYFVFGKDIELTCDESVIKDKNSVWKANYCQALLACSTKERKIWMISLAFGEISVKERVLKVMKYKKKNISLVVVAALIVVVVAACAGTASNNDKNGAAKISNSRQNTEESAEALDADTDSNSFEGTVPVVDLSASTGADGAMLYYADDEKIIFGGCFGLYVYDTKNHKFIQSVDLATIGYAATQGDEACEIKVKKDGSEVYLLQKITSSANMLVYDVATNTFTTRPPELDEAELYKSNLENYSYTETGYVSAATGKNAECWLINSFKTIGELGYKYPTRDDKVYPLFRDERFKEANYFSASEISDLVRAEITYNEQYYSCTDKAILAKLEEGLSAGKKVSDLGGCPYNDVLYLTKADGTVGMVTLAMDSCKNGIFEDGIYDLEKSMEMSIYDMIKKGLFKETGTQVEGIGQIGSEGIFFSEANRDKDEVIKYETNADVTHDGKLDKICVFGPSDDMSDKEWYIEVYRGNAENSYEEKPEFVSRSFHTAHALNGCSLLVKYDGKDYLLFGNNYEMQGEAQYYYRLVYIDDKEGIIVEDGADCEFYVEEEMHDDWADLVHREDCLPEFKSSIEKYLDNAQLLLAADVWSGMMYSADNRLVDANEYYDLIWKRKD